jgi:hypothetical protein
MFRSKIKNKYRCSRNSRFYQGDILKDLVFVVGDAGEDIELDKVGLQNAVVLTQDCDIEHDFKSRKEKEKNGNKFLRSLLICPAFKIEDFASGKHLDWEMNTFTEKELTKLKNNDEYKRYHYLQGSIEYSVPELILDFKHFFTLPREFLYKKKKQIYVASLNELFREELSQRFTNYLSRIGLPELQNK